MRKFWTIFGLRTPRLHFAHNTKNGFMTIERSKLHYYFFLVMHLHTQKIVSIFHVFFVHFGSDGASCVKKMETEFLALSLLLYPKLK